MPNYSRLGVERGGLIRRLPPKRIIFCLPVPTFWLHDVLVSKNYSRTSGWDHHLKATSSPQSPVFQHTKNLSSQISIFGISSKWPTLVSDFNHFQNQKFETFFCFQPPVTNHLTDNVVEIEFKLSHSWIVDKMNIFQVMGSTCHVNIKMFKTCGKALQLQYANEEKFCPNMVYYPS